VVGSRVLSFEDLGGWKSILSTLTEGRDLTGAQASAAMHEILSGSAGAAQIAGFIVALRMKGETVEELSGMVDAMLAAAAPLDLPASCADAVDIVGTGGAPSRRVHALNVSTMACFVVAGTGVKVCKHGNRKASSTSGSFDLLDELGVAVDLDGPTVVRCVEEAGVGFCFARSFHPAMRHAGPVRAELGVPTVFNFLGPLSHPGRVRRQVIGVADLRMAPTVVGVLRARGAPRAMVVHGHDSMDELTTTGTSTVYELRDGVVRTYELHPEDVGIEIAAPVDIAGGDAAANAAIAERVFGGEEGPYSDIVSLNAAAALFVAGRVDDLAAGVALARASIDQGHAQLALDRLIAVAGRPRAS
jgi:anthranilate phosphoribosyltransferase